MRTIIFLFNGDDTTYGTHVDDDDDDDDYGYYDGSYKLSQIPELMKKKISTGKPFPIS